MYIGKLETHTPEVHFVSQIHRLEVSLQKTLGFVFYLNLNLSSCSIYPERWDTYFMLRRFIPMLGLMTRGIFMFRVPFFPRSVRGCFCRIFKFTSGLIFFVSWYRNNITLWYCPYSKEQIWVFSMFLYFPLVLSCSCTMAYEVTIPPRCRKSNILKCPPDAAI